MAAEKRNKGYEFTVDDVTKGETLLDSLAAGPDPTPDKFSLRRTIERLYPRIKQLKEKGYTMEMVAKQLETVGITIPTRSLASNVSALARADKSSDKSRDKGEQRGDTSTMPTRSGFTMKPDTTV